MQKERRQTLRSILSGIMALAWFALAALPAHANDGFIAYKPGDIKAAIARGETVLLHYKSTW
jgi:hypothetical protein